MGSVSTAIKKSIVRRAYADGLAASPARTLLQELERLETEVATSISGGVVASVSGNGKSVTLSNTEALLGGYTPVTRLETLSELIDLYNLVFSQITPAPNDAAVKTEMMARLVPCYEMELDSTGLRFPVAA